MKKHFAFAAILAIALSCSVSEIDSIDGTTAPDITASFENDHTKTTITTDEDGVGTIWWTPADEINVFYDKTSTHYVSKNTENATTVAFGTTDIIGSTESATDNFWGLYPYDENAMCDGSCIITTIPSSQKAVAGAFADDLFTSLAHSTSTTMTFYNVLGGIKFSLSRDDIQSITFMGNNNENIAGKVRLEMNSDGRPEATIVEGEKTITLTLKEGTTFAKNTNYYIVMLPVVLSDGFTMTFETEDEIGTFEYTTKPIEIKRSVFGIKENIDTFATFIEKGPAMAIPDAVDLGLSVKWASFNLGATAPEEYGNYYAWGEVATKDAYYYPDGGNADNSRWVYYKWANNMLRSDGSTYAFLGLTKYTTSSVKTYNNAYDNKKQLDAEDDAAIVTLGNGWRMPTATELDELHSKCTWEWTTHNGVKGYKVSRNGKSIFLPCTGWCSSSNIPTRTDSGSYWSSSLNYPNYADCAWALDFDENYVVSPKDGYCDTRYYGHTIRPVHD